MSHTERKARRDEIRDRYALGRSVKQLAKQYGLHPTYIQSLCHEISRVKRQNRGYGQVAPGQQRKNSLALDAQYATWQASHIQYCEAFEGDCCPRCHLPGEVMEFYERGDQIIYVCCAKVRDNPEAFGFSSMYAKYKRLMDGE